MKSWSQITRICILSCSAVAAISHPVQRVRYEPQVIGQPTFGRGRAGEDRLNSEYPGGSFHGTLADLQISGTWSDTAGNSGNFTLAGDGCLRFNGGWNPGDPAGWSGSWDGKRARATLFLPLMKR